MNLYLKQIELGPLQNFVYLIGSLETRECAVVDPGWDVPAILNAAAQDEMRITKILITHTHFDHINGVPEILKATDAQVIVHKKEIEAVPVEGPSILGVEGGAKVALGNLELSLLHTPGHTPGSICFMVADRLISGDTLFIGGCGRCDLPGGD
ncbi:MAG: MBL fold metallo-hydrolase, partial [Candidatus Omnitrophota bacterium]|nr:MBL fold metallo-hydrolase [Candidatus Omnitrophota bacterium]